jgi:hypothetical protein
VLPKPSLRLPGTTAALTEGRQADGSPGPRQVILYLAPCA